MSDKAEKRRRFPRIPSKHAVLVKRLSGEESEGLAATKSVGTGGCGFLSDEELGTGSILELLISVDRQVIRATAEVIYDQPDPSGRRAIGVEFLELGEDDRVVLEQLTDE